MSKSLDELAMEYSILAPGPWGYPKDITPEDKSRAIKIWEEISRLYPLSQSIVALDKARKTLKLIDPSIELIGESQ